MGFFNFPHTRTYDTDLGWIIDRILKQQDQMDNQATYMQELRAWMDENEPRIEHIEEVYDLFESGVLPAEVVTALENWLEQYGVLAEAKAYTDQAAAELRATDTYLQTEIDQIVAPSGEAPSVAEVTNARIGFDGTVYNSLGDAIRGQVSDVKSQMDEAIDNIFAGVYTTINQLYINTGSHTIEQGSATPPLVLVIIPIDPDTKYTVWKQTATIMRVATGASASPAVGERYTNAAYHTSPSNAALQITSGPNDRYMYLQLYSNSDTAALRALAPNIRTLMVYTHDYETLAADIADIRATYFTRLAGLVTGNDLNDYRTLGIHGIGYSAELVNAPNTDLGRRFICVYGGGSVTYQVYNNMETGACYMRVYADGAWNEWKEMYTQEVRIRAMIAQSNNLVQRYREPNSRRFNFGKGKMWQYMWDTMPAFQAAMEDPDCWSVNVDVRETSDGELVCFHNATVGNGFTDCEDQTAKIEDMTYSQTQEFNVIKGIWNGTSWLQGDPVKIPKLIDVLNLVRSYGKVLIVETKAKDTVNISALTTEGMERLVDLVINAGMLQGCAFMCGTAGNAWLLANHPETMRMYGADTITINYISQRLNDKNSIFLAHNSSLTEDVLSYARSNGVLIGGFTPRTVNDEDDDMLAKNLDVISIHQAPPAR